MTKKAANTAQFGAFLTQRRGDRSLGQVAQRAKSRGYQISTTALFRYETQGRVPKVDALAAIAAGYGLDFMEICSRVAAELNGQPVPLNPPLSEEALQIAQAYDAGPPQLRALLDDALALLPARPPSTPAAAPRRRDLPDSGVTR